MTVISDFYAAFAKRDAEGMVACYADDVRFSDPVFPDLHGRDAKNMWRMLCERGQDLDVSSRDVKIDGNRGSAHWEATYTFSVTGNKVHNVIDAAFVLANDKIVEHVDTFDLWRWSRQALGLKGVLLGWSPLVKNAIRKTAARGLAEWSAKRQH